MCIQCLGHFSSLAIQQKLFCPYLQFCWRESRSNNRKDQGLLLVDMYLSSNSLFTFRLLYCMVIHELFQFLHLILVQVLR
jgi:hypothetical protein